MSVAFLQKLYYYRFQFFSWRSHSNALTLVILAVMMAAITGIAAQVRFPLPFSPVPVTGQSFAVLLSGVVLGRFWGGASQALYLGLGMMGLPWFAGAAGGMAVIMGPTGGYIIGFVLAALFLGSVVDRSVRSRYFLPMFLLMLGVTLFLIFLPGLLQLALWSKFVAGNAVSFSEILWMGFWPFLPGAVVKCALAAMVARLITPKMSYAKQAQA